MNNEEPTAIAYSRVLVSEGQPVSARIVRDLLDILDSRAVLIQGQHERHAAIWDEGANAAFDGKIAPQFSAEYQENPYRS